MKVLVCDDDPDAVKVLKIRLEKKGFEVFEAFTGRQGVDMANSVLPDLMILDFILPDIEGLEVLRELKTEPRTSSIPVIMLTAMSANTDELSGLETGADDYVKKPYDFAVLNSRINRLVRPKDFQRKDEHHKTLTVGGLLIDSSRQKAFVNKKEIALSTLEFRILRYLAERPGRVISRDQLINAAWKEHVTVVDRVVDVHLNKIRQKLGKLSNYIETVRGTGYRFTEVE